MDWLLYFIASGLIALLRVMPLDGVARLGRFGGAAFYYLDARHRRVAKKNLTMCFGSEKSAEEILALALENFKRIGENYICAIKTAFMAPEALTERIEVSGLEKIVSPGQSLPATSLIFAIGHFGNFEAFAHAVRRIKTHRGATTYRALKTPAVDRLLLRLRESSGTLFFERRSGGGALRTALRRNDLVLGLLTDQHSGDHGLRLPFLGHDCNTTKAPAVFALRFNAPLYTAICYRTRLAHWRIEVGDEIPTHHNGQPRELSEIMLDVNRAFEIAVRRDPANWFWVHNRWKKANGKLAAAEPKLNAADPEIPEAHDAAAEIHHGG